jgi:hypothetical protein
MSKKIAPNARFITVVILMCAAFFGMKAGQTDAVSPAPLPLPAIAAGCATPVFGTADNFGAGANPFSVAVGDFNLDGKPDLAAANVNSATVSVLLGNGMGGFAMAVNFDVAQ